MMTTMMRGVTLIADVTGNNFGFDTKSLQLIQKLCGEYGIGTVSDVTCLVRTDQAAFHSMLPGALFHYSDRLGVRDVAAGLLTQHQMMGRRNTIVLASFFDHVLDLAGQNWAPLNIIRVQFKVMLANERRTTPPGPPGLYAPPPRALPAPAHYETSLAWRFDHVAPLETALHVLCEALRKKEATTWPTALQSTQIRPAMRVEDPAFAGDADVTGTSGMVTLLLRIAEARGLIEIQRTAPHWRVKLRTDGVAPAMPAVVNAPPANAGSMAGDSAANGAETATTSPAYLSRQFGALMRSAGRDVYSDARWLYYCAIDSVLESAQKESDGAEITLVDLIPRAKETAVQLAREAGKAQQPWRSTQTLIETLMIDAGVLIDAHGDAMPPTWASATLPLKRLHENWKIKCDALLILELIGLTEVATSDVDEVARMLYRRCTEDEANRTRAALRELLALGKIEDVMSQGRRIFRLAKPSALRIVHQNG